MVPLARWDERDATAVTLASHSADADAADAADVSQLLQAVLVSATAAAAAPDAGNENGGPKKKKKGKTSLSVVVPTLLAAAQARNLAAAPLATHLGTVKHLYGSAPAAVVGCMYREHSGTKMEEVVPATQLHLYIRTCGSGSGSGSGSGRTFETALVQLEGRDRDSDSRDSSSRAPTPVMENGDACFPYSRVSIAAARGGIEAPTSTSTSSSGGSGGSGGHPVLLAAVSALLKDADSTQTQTQSSTIARVFVDAQPANMGPSLSDLRALLPNAKVGVGVGVGGCLCLCTALHIIHLIGGRLRNDPSLTAFLFPPPSLLLFFGTGDARTAGRCSTWRLRAGCGRAAQVCVCIYRYI